MVFDDVVKFYPILFVGFAGRDDEMGVVFCLFFGSDFELYRFYFLLFAGEHYRRDDLICFPSFCEALYVDGFPDDRNFFWAILISGEADASDYVVFPHEESSHFFEVFIR